MGLRCHLPFTYQGTLANNGVPADGVYDVRFRLYDAATAGAALGAELCVNDMSVAAGQMAATLDFGQQFATDAARFLEIDVRVDSGLGCGDGAGFVTLLPRQQISSTPRAVASRVAQALAADGSTTSAVSVASDGKVGVGTTAPTAPLHVFGNLAAVRVQDDSDAGSSLLLQDDALGVGRLSKVAAAGSATLDLSAVPSNGTGSASITFFRNTTTSGLRRVQFYPGNGGSFVSSFIGVGGQSSAFQIDGGNFGIGTLAPQRSLHVSTTEPVLVLQDNNGTTSTQSGYVSFWNQSSVETAWVGYGTPGSPHFTMINARTGGDLVLSAASGRVRIGTSGERYVPQAEENLRIVRGRVFSNGTVRDGGGFTVSRVSTGRYQVMFNTAFSDIPSVTAIVETVSGEATKFVQRGPQEGADRYLFEVIQRSDGSYADGAFSFIAVGPR